MCRVKCYNVKEVILMMMHSILIIGQSNMAGRGKREEVDPIVNPNLLVLRNGRWRNMYIPVNPDRITSGVCLAESFADLYSKAHGDVATGIIPCADGGSSIDMWTVGGLLFDHACYQAELASRTSTIAAVLWHQGESDCSEELYPVYEKKLEVIFDAFRKRLDLHDVPFIVGGLGDFMKIYFQNDNYLNINSALEHYASTHPMTAFASAEGLGSNPDNLHFSASALREFGERYYTEFSRIEDKNKIFSKKSSPDEAIRTGLEAL